MLKKIIADCFSLHRRLAPFGQDALLLFVRIVWGWGFYQTGMGKLQNLERTTKFFASINIPAPELNAQFAGTTELLGGLLLLAGLGSRIIPVPLIVTMVVAYATAHPEELGSLWQFPNIDPFLGAAPFPFLMAALIVFLFGSGRISADYLLSRFQTKGAPTLTKN